VNVKKKRAQNPGPAYFNDAKQFHKVSSGKGAVTATFSFETGWIKEIVRA